MFSKMRLAACGLVMVTSLTGCSTYNSEELFISDLQAGDPVPLIDEVPAIENTELPYVPAVDSMNEARVRRCHSIRHSDFWLLCSLGISSFVINVGA